MMTRRTSLPSTWLFWAFLVIVYTLVAFVVVSV